MEKLESYRELVVGDNNLDPQQPQSGLFQKKVVFKPHINYYSGGISESASSHLASPNPAVAAGDNPPSQLSSQLSLVLGWLLLAFIEEMDKYKL